MFSNRLGVTAAAPHRCISPFSLPAVVPVVHCHLIGSHVRRLCLFAGIGVAAVAPIGGRAQGELASIEEQAGVPNVDSFGAFVAEAAQRFGIPASWIRAVMRVESAGDVHALSPKGAMGLMQIMPETWADLRSRYGLGADPFDPHDNILAGAACLRELHDRYGSPGFLAAYNAGPSRYEDHLATGHALPDETRAYVTMVGALIGTDAPDSGIVSMAIGRPWTDAPLFAVHAADNSDATRSASHRQTAARSSVGSGDDWTALAPQSAGLFVRMSHRNPQP
jgi:hypothetical protein